MRVLYFIVRNFPHVRGMLQAAHIKETPENFIKKTFALSVYASVAFTLLLFFLFDKINVPLFFLLVFFPLSFIFMFFILIQSPTVTIRKREREINKEVLFAGRYILVKLDSGVPLFNALADASKSYGISAKYFKEIVDDIRVGRPIEEALDLARESSPSKYFKLILSELITSLKTGVDVTIALREVLQQITKEQIIEIKEYGKKLNAFMMLYMVLATVLPSLGITMFMLLAGFMNLELGNGFIFLTMFLLAFMQYVFLAVLKSMRPMVNL